MSDFTIDFFEFMFLVEACLPPVPIARAMFFQNVTDKYYYQMTDNERKQLFRYITKNPSFDLEQEDCRVFQARFDPTNQYFVTTNFHGTVQGHDCFKMNDVYHINKTKSVEPGFIVDVKQVWGQTE